MTHQRRTSQRRRAGEGGFTLIELLVVMIIIAILLVALLAALHSAKVSARQRAMATSAGSVAQALASFNRMNPPIGGTDRLMSASTWKHDQTEAAGGLYSTTGDRLLDPWPVNPYTGNPVVITRGACPATPPIGAVVVCRLPPAPTTSRSAFRVVAGARDGNGNPLLVYDKSFG